MLGHQLRSLGINPMAPGIYLIDVRDKANPRPVHYLPATGVHSVSVHRIDGEDYVFAVMVGVLAFVAYGLVGAP